jgi:16S rRNA (uracil1498-N3)-methyltransferase
MPAVYRRDARNRANSFLYRTGSTKKETLMNLFYADPEDIHESVITIRGQEAKHISKVMRFSEGDEIRVTDGRGSDFACKVDQVSKNEVLAVIQQKKSEERKKPYLILCMGIIKKRDRLEFAVEKSVELGIDEIVLFRGVYSQKENVREDRLNAAALSAMKQSLRFWLPEIRVAKSLEEALSSLRKNCTVIAADETKEVQEYTLPKTGCCMLVVGPEGGFSEKERNVLKTCSARYCSLGKKRLRTETACMIMTDRFRNGLG